MVKTSAVQSAILIQNGTQLYPNIAKKMLLDLKNHLAKLWRQYLKRCLNAKQSDKKPLCNPIHFPTTFILNINKGTILDISPVQRVTDTGSCLIPDETILPWQWLSKVSDREALSYQLCP